MPPYICELVAHYVPTRALRSADQGLLCQPKFNLKNVWSTLLSYLGTYIMELNAFWTEEDRLL